MREKSNWGLQVLQKRVVYVGKKKEKLPFPAALAPLAAAEVVLGDALLIFTLQLIRPSGVARMERIGRRTVELIQNPAAQFGIILAVFLSEFSECLGFSREDQ